MLSQFQKNEAGQYVYAGAFMETELPQHEYRRRASWLMALSAVLLVLSLLSGCAPDTGMGGTFCLLLPYAAGFILDILLFAAWVRILPGKGVLRQYVYERTVQVMPRRAAIRSILGAAGLAGYLFLRTRGTYTGGGTGEILYILSQAAGLLGGLALFFGSRRIPWSSRA